MLDQRGVFIVQDQVFQGTVKVVGLSKSKTRGRLVNHTMFDLSIHAVGKEENVRPQLEKRTVKNLTIPVPSYSKHFWFLNGSINESFSTFKESIFRKKDRFNSFKTLFKTCTKKLITTNHQNLKINDVSKILLFN